MTEVTIKYSIFMTIMAAPIVAVFAIWTIGYISFIEALSLLFLIIGAASIYWGCYYMIGGEALTATVDFFIGKKNHDDHDIERIVRDLGKCMVIIGCLILAGSILLYFTSNLLSIVIFWGIAFAVFLVFFVACKKDKYLKNP
ncbi:MAG: hypothetical protein FWC29_00940 [Methanomassiliicoccaceae archaeon]|nr:hypothetical protein [Methanomassiliicoccaceae archaeon]